MRQTHRNVSLIHLESKFNRSARCASFAFLCFLITFLPSFLGLAAPTDKQQIVLVSLTDCCPKTAWAEAERNIGQELKIHNIPLAISPAALGDESMRRRQLSLIAKKHNAAIAICLIKKESFFVELWIVDRVNQKISIREFNQKEMNRGDGAMIVAMRTVEAIKASLLEIRMKKKSSPTAAAPHKLTLAKEVVQLTAETELAPRKPRATSFGAGVNSMVSDDSAGWRSGFEVSIRWKPWAVIGFECNGAFFPFGKDVETPAVVSDIDILLFRGWLIWHMGGNRRISPFLGLGGGTMMVFAEGIESRDYQLQAGRTNVGYGATKAGVSFFIRPSVSLSALFVLGLPFPEVQVQSGQSDAATLGRPIFEGALRIEFFLPGG